MDDKLYDFKNMDADNIFEALKNISEQQIIQYIQNQKIK